MKATRISQFSLITCLITLIATQCIQAGTFRDDFEDGDLEGWRQDAPKEPMLWEVVDGELQCTRHSDKSAVLITGDVTWKDYTIFL